MPEFSKNNPYAKKLIVEEAAHQCRVCDWMIPANRLLCDEHYYKTPKALRPFPGMKGTDYDRISAYWWEQVHEKDYVCPIDRTMKV